MKIRKIHGIKLITGIMALSILLGGCSAFDGLKNTGNSKQVKISHVELKDDPDIKAEINFDDVKSTEYNSEDLDAAYRRYSFNLFSRAVKDYGGEGNVMISPASIMMALDMVAAGAKGESLQQLTDLLAQGQGPLKQQAYAAALMKTLNETEDVKFSCANAVWNNARNLGDKVNMDYVSYIRETFLAEYTVTEFDEKTPGEINAWVSEHTDRMIEKVIDELDPDAAMLLVNAISFEGEWTVAYNDDSVTEGNFTSSDGSAQSATFLNDSSTAYYETDKATGFIKRYKGGRYSFLAILPADDRISANEFAENFTYEDYEKFINSVTYQYTVISKMPEFKSDFELLLNNTVTGLGAGDIFIPDKADFSGIAGKPGDICISRIIHKTHIEVDREGTRASAVTAIEPTVAGIEEYVEPEYRYVNCDRPFVYAIVDGKTMTPVFIGTVNSVN